MLRVGGCGHAYPSRSEYQKSTLGRTGAGLSSWLGRSEVSQTARKVGRERGQAGKHLIQSPGGTRRCGSNGCAQQPRQRPCDASRTKLTPVVIIGCGWRGRDASPQL